jgi:hypothetical protein
LNNVPWNLVVCAALGAWVMASPAALDIAGPAANSNYLAGALVVTWSVVGFGEVARPARLLNVPVAIWMAAAPWIIDGASDTSRWANLLAGLLLVALSLRRGRIAEQFGGWNRYLM